MSDVVTRTYAIAQNGWYFLFSSSTFEFRLTDFERLP